jgi:hypothetical protein
MKTRGYSDIAYNYVIMPSGRVYVGRGAEVLGAHTIGHNKDVGVCFAGNYEVERPTRASIVAYWLLRQRLHRKFNIGRRIYPHCRTYSTSCPGRHLRAKLRLSCD